MNDARHYDVLIVGAGPTGLMMAAQLLRYGIQPLIIDSRNGPSAHSKAMVVQARTLELYAQMGIAAEAVENGRKLSGLQLHAGDGQSSIELGEAVQDVSEF
ncbi:MAG: FAD-dependent monooxygenase, partial [Mucilaginibacter polytrichastri]|nr:FAD-dependent monooxygenase [Mucilaginibacter polytrichastri]